MVWLPYQIHGICMMMHLWKQSIKVTPGCVSCSARPLSHEVVGTAAPPQPGPLVKAELVQKKLLAALCPAPGLDVLSAS